MTSLRAGRIPSLDGIRAVAIILVILTHLRASYQFPGMGPFAWIASHGLLGVEFFFCLSGFLITLLLLREIDRSGTISLRAFYLRRTLRIFPAWLVYLAVVASLTIRGDIPFRLNDWIGAVTYTYNFHAQQSTWELGHLWSLSIEEQFYVVWPAMLLLARARWRPWLGAIALVGTLLLRLALAATGRVGYAWTPCRLDSIAAGCWLATAVWNADQRSMISRLLASPLTALIAFAGLVAMTFVRDFPAIYMTFGYSVNATFIASLIGWLVLNPRTIPARILNLPVMRTIGVWSYSLYLWQQLFLAASPHPWTRWPYNLLWAALAAAMSYLLIERPMLRLKDRLGAKRHGSVAPTESSTLVGANPTGT